MRNILLITLLFIYISATIAQENCSKMLDQAFISDGQSHKISLSEAEPSKLFYTFVEGLTYQIATCSEKNIHYELKIFDTNKKLMFSGVCATSFKRWDLRFNSTVSCIAEFRLLSSTTKNKQLKVTIGFK